MKYSFSLCLFLLLNFSPSFQQSECESVSDPTGVSSCKGKTTSSNSETCCYSKYNDEDGDGNECIEINSVDAETNEKLESALFLILEGNYWKDYTDSYNSLNVDCGNGTVFVNEESQCELVDANSYSSCKGKTTRSSSYTCCYAYNDDEESCFDIKKEDAEDGDKLDDAIEKIKKGQYWNDYNETFDDLEIDCSSGFLKGIFVALFAVFFL